MVSSFTKTESTGFVSRVMSSFVGVLIGILMIPGSVILLSWNEYRTIHRARGLNEAAQVVVTVPQIDAIDANLDNQLVHLSGRAESREELSDPLLPTPRKLIHLRRSVEMYQWVEEVETRTRDKVGGGQETSKVYTYRLEWQPNRVASEKFEKTSGHENPGLAFDSQTTSSDQVFVGAYPLNASLIDSIDNWKKLSIDKAALERLPNAQGGEFSILGNYLYWSKVKTIAKVSEPKPSESSTAVDSNSTVAELPPTPAQPASATETPTTLGGNSVPSGAANNSTREPQLGDLRISFDSVEATDVSFVSAWNKDHFEPYVTSNQERIERLYLGKLSAAEVFAGLQQENTLLAWLLRLGGFVLCGVGFSLILGPLSTIASIIPFFGKLTRWLVGLVSLLLAVIVASITIAVAWIAVRPVLGISLLTVAGIGVFALIKLRSSNKSNNSVSPSPSSAP